MGQHFSDPIQAAEKEEFPAMFDWRVNHGKPLDILSFVILHLVRFYENMSNTFFNMRRPACEL
jgi:hypothetical protein